MTSSQENNSHTDIPATAYQMAIAAINGVKYPGQIEKMVPSSQLAKQALYPKSPAESLTMDEFRDLQARKAHRLTELRLPTGSEAAIPEDVPEFLHHPPMPQVEFEQSKPYVPDHSNLQPHEFDARERAAGEHLDRER